MKRGRSFLILLAVAAGLGAYIWFVEMNRDLNATDSPAEKLFTVDASAIQEVRMKNEAGETSTLQRKGDGWTIAELAGVDADSTEAGNVVSSLASLESQRIVDDAPASLAEYGLDAPRATVAFTDPAGVDHTLLIGSKTPTGGDLYAKLADAPRVFLIGSWLEETFNRSRFDLRDKSIVKFARDAVSSVTITSASGTIALAQKNGEWRMTSPSDAPADAAAVDGLLNTLMGARMQSIVDTPNPASMGLTRPAASVAIAAGPTRAVLEVGGPAADGTVYARDTVRDLVFTVESSVADQLKKTADDFRKKDQ